MTTNHDIATVGAGVIPKQCLVLFMKHWQALPPLTPALSRKGRGSNRALLVMATESFQLGANQSPLPLRERVRVRGSQARDVSVGVPMGLELLQ